MIWAAWRQQRLVVVLWVAAVAALVGYMLVVGHAYQADAHLLVTYHCGTAPSYLNHFTHFCEASNSSLSNDRLQTLYIVGALYILPCVGGVVLGAPLVAGELERKTNRLAWTQGVSRTRWFLSKWGVAAAAVVLPVAGVAALMSWWLVPVERDDLILAISPRYFDATGVVIIGYALFAFALGVLLGTVIRRTLPTALATVVGFGLFRWWVQDGLRPHYLAPITLGVRPDMGLQFIPGGGGWFVGFGYEAPSGVSATAVVRLCESRAEVGSMSDRFTTCITAHHLRLVEWYQPASRYWPFQGIEVAIFVGAALVLLGATVWLVRRWRA